MKYINKKKSRFTVISINGSVLNSAARPKSAIMASKLLESKIFLAARSPCAIYRQEIKNVHVSLRYSIPVLQER